MIKKLNSKRKIFSITMTAVILSTVFTGCNNNVKKTNSQISKNDTYASLDENDDSNYTQSNKSNLDESEKEFEYDDSSSNNNKTDNDNKSHTVMIYMVASDLESVYGAASEDLSEIKKAQPDLNKNNVIIYTGGTSKWHNSSVETDKNCILELRDDDFYIKETYDSQNMGKSDSLSNFINYCMTEYYTDNYSLILWNHGAGPVIGFGLDENYNDILSLIEIKSALENSIGKTNKKLELIGFDACLMSTLEVAEIFVPYANYMVASQETEPGYGWNYEFLSELSASDISGDILGEKIIDSYIDYSYKFFNNGPEYYADITLSCLDLQKYHQVEEAVNTYFNELDNTLNINTFAETIRKRNKLCDFGDFSADYNYSLVDLVELVEILSEETNGQSIQQFMNVYEEFVVYQKTNIKGANGISICFPNNTEKIYYETYVKLIDNIGFASSYASFLNNIYTFQNGEPIITNWDISNAEATVTDTEITEANITTQGKEITFQLTEEQQKNFAGASFYILANVKKLGYFDEEKDPRAEDMYFLSYCEHNVQMNDDGKIHAFHDNNLIYVDCYDKFDRHTLSTTPLLLFRNKTSERAGEKRYTSLATFKRVYNDFWRMQLKSAKLQVICDEEHPDGYIRSAVPLSSDDNNIHTPNKQLLNISDYNTMEVSAGMTKYLTKDDNGNILPFYDWEESTISVSFETRIDKGIKLTSMPIPDPENYVCMFVICDAQGNSVASNLIPLK